MLVDMTRRSTLGKPRKRLLTHLRVYLENIAYKAGLGSKFNLK